MKATKRMADSVWTAEYEVVGEGKVKILSYSRRDPEGYSREHELPQCELHENGEKTVTHLLLKPFKSGEFVNSSNATEKHIVINPGHVFSYGLKLSKDSRRTFPANIKVKSSVPGMTPIYAVFLADEYGNFDWVYVHPEPYYTTWEEAEKVRTDLIRNEKTVTKENSKVKKLWKVQ